MKVCLLSMQLAINVNTACTGIVIVLLHIMFLCQKF